MLKSRKPVPDHKHTPHRSPRYDPIVYTSKSVYMQRLLDAVSHAHQLHVPGDSTDDKVWRLVQKLVPVYRIDLDRNAQARLRDDGRGTAKMLLWRHAPGQIHWHLLVSRTGEHPARQLERLRDALHPQTRVTLTGYELVRLPKPAAKALGKAAPEKPPRQSSIVRHAKAQSGRLSWTWRMTAKNYENWRLRAIHTAKMGNALEVQQFLDVLYATPGFRGCRYQVGKIMALFRSEWRRARSDKEPLPPDRPLYYHRRLPDAGMHLRALLRESRKAERDAGVAAESAIMAQQAEFELEPPTDGASTLVCGLPSLQALVEKAQAEVGGPE